MRKEAQIYFDPLVSKRYTSMLSISLLASPDPALIIISQSRRIDNFNALAQTDYIRFLPPFRDRVFCRFALVCGTLIVCVHEAAETGAIAADYDDGLADPALDVLDVVAVGAAESIDDVDKLGPDVAEHVHVAGGGAKGHDHGGVLDEAEGLGVQSVPEDVV